MSVPQLSSRDTQRMVAHALFEVRNLIRNGEQLLVTLVIPMATLITLVNAPRLVPTSQETTPINLIVPGVLALAVIASTFTSQAIATAFDRRYGVLRFLGTTPLGSGGLLGGKAIAIGIIVAFQTALVALTALSLDWQPRLTTGAWAVLSVFLGTVCFTALALLLAGTLRAEAVLALANLLLMAFIAGGSLFPVAELPGALPTFATYLPPGALGEALRITLINGSVPWTQMLTLALWSVAAIWGCTKWFRWS